MSGYSGFSGYSGKGGYTGITGTAGTTGFAGITGSSSTTLYHFSSDVSAFHGMAETTVSTDSDFYLPVRATSYNASEVSPLTTVNKKGVSTKYSAADLYKSAN